jgi:hypothetical protein
LTIKILFLNINIYKLYIFYADIYLIFLIDKYMIIYLCHYKQIKNNKIYNYYKYSINILKLIRFVVINQSTMIYPSKIVFENSCHAKDICQLITKLKIL